MRSDTIGLAVVAGLAGSMALGAGLLFACTSTLLTPPARTAGLQCTNPGTPVWVGASSPEMTPGRFTVTAGTYQLSGRHFAPPAPIAIIPTGFTQAIWGPGSTIRTYDRQRSTDAHATKRVDVTRDEPAVLHLDAGRYWIVNTYGVSLELAPCDGGRLSEVTALTGRLVPPTPAAGTTGTADPTPT